MLSNALHCGDISGCRIARQCSKISHLFFPDDSLLFCKASVGECCAIQIILSKYERASGQSINFQKSAMLFSPNVDVALRQEIHGITRMKVVQHLGKYLGLPSHLSRNKRSDLNFIKERVQKLLAGWKRSIFSIGGKEILIKAVAQAIPTYSMSCIRLPKALCNDLSRLMANFWWGSSPGSRKIHWLSWEKNVLVEGDWWVGFP